ncbi:hypothetical protein [Pectobacterium carotovorum]|uniref:hypothetical protein n=1 Tax=Pectobacterium carotovorum TaxID=554 RepID=UPI00057FDA31|nr:hypothetical protein [Pectobacterium carotovorum]KHT36735.1 hypothetical protein RC99_04250 [Pectobacterium carotovorum subsp. carotovorum]MBA0192253.1 hypothetical protein [Pectobacterium carotovorum]MBA0199534.1 hypothetical protein [Pectobacterium carotovorum]
MKHLINTSLFIIINCLGMDSSQAQGKYADTFGNFDTATGDYLIVNNDDGKVEVSGFKDDSEQADYVNRDHVGYYIGMYGPQNQIITKQGEVSFSKNGFYIPNEYDLSAIRLGMFVTTVTKDKYYGRVMAIDKNKRFITVSGWYKSKDKRSMQVPNNGDSLVVNSADKIWGQNTNIFISRKSTAKTATGYELGIFSDGSQGNPIWGFHAVNLSNNGAPYQQAFRATGNWNVGYYSSDDIDYGVFMDEPKRAAMVVTNNKSERWAGTVVSLISKFDNDNSYLIRSYARERLKYYMRADGTQSEQKLELLRIAKNTILSADGPSIVICKNKYPIFVFLPNKNERGKIIEIKATSKGDVNIFNNKKKIILNKKNKSYVKIINDGDEWVVLTSGE